MMISPKTFYEFEVKNKTKEGILKVIKRLQKDIDKLTKSINNPKRVIKEITLPDEETVLSCYEEYLKVAKKAYEEKGGIL